MKIAIVGSGAMGSLYGGILAEHGNEVYFIDIFKEHIDMVNEKGLTIVEDDKERIVKGIRGFTNSEEVREKMDLVIIFVKSTLTDVAISQNLSIIDDNTTVLTLQNGIGNIEKINKYIDKKQIIVGTSANGASFIEAGKIKHSGHGGTVLGEIDGQVTDRIMIMERLLDIEKLGGARISEDVMSLIWEKLIVNCGINPITALSGLKNGELLDYEESEKMMEKVVEEAIGVAKKIGIELSFDDAEYCKSVARATSENTSSMLADILNCRRTEIANINGAVVRIGKEYKMDVDLNETLVNLILLKENSYC